MWAPSADWEPWDEAYVDVWRVPVDLPAELARDAAAILSPEESARMVAFARQEDRDRFLCARSALRRILSRYLGIAPVDIRLAASENGKPCLRQSPVGRGNPEFNLSHSGTWAVIAVGDGPVGVDVEALRSDFEWLRIAKEFFPARTVAEILACPPELRPQAFFLAWTRLEAYLKGLGIGLAKGAAGYLSEMDTLITSSITVGTAGNGWQIRNLDLGAGHALALAWTDARARIRQWTWAW